MVRDLRTKLSPDEVRTLATAIGLSGGMTLLSDDLPLLSQGRIDLAAMFLPPLPRSAVPHDLTSSDMPERFDYDDSRSFDPLRLVGLFNFDDTAREIGLALPSGTWHAFELWTEEYLGEVTGALRFDDVPAHACRLLVLRPVRGTPAVVATNAHVGSGTLDITSQGWEEASGTLTLAVAPHGLSSRRIWIAKAQRSAVSATFAGEPVTLADEGSLTVVSLDVRAAGDLRITFA
jgi:hypothetical protein